MPQKANVPLSLPTASQAGSLAMGQAEMAAAAALGAVMTNAATVQAACQQIELSVVAVVTAKILASAGS